LLSFPGRRFCDIRGLFFRRHRSLETPDALAESFAELGKFLRAEYQQGDSENYKHVHRLKQSFKQVEPPLFSGVAVETYKIISSEDDSRNAGAVTAGFRTQRLLGEAA
jgi:hypothetical protein